MQWIARATVVTVLAAAVAIGGLALARMGTEDLPAGNDHSYVVPTGTGVLLDSGGTVEILPRDLEVHVGDSLVVRNDDERPHSVGPWSVKAHSTFRFRFKQVGRYDSHCSLHRGGGRFFIDVLA